MAATPIVGAPIIMRQVTSQLHKVNNRPPLRHYKTREDGQFQDRHDNNQEVGRNLYQSKSRYHSNPNYHNSNNGYNHYNHHQNTNRNYNRYDNQNNNRIGGWRQHQNDDCIITTQSRPIMSATTCATTIDNIPEHMVSAVSSTISKPTNENTTTTTTQQNIEDPERFAAKPQAQHLPPNMTSQKFPITSLPHYYPAGFSNHNPTDDRVQIYVHDDESVDSFLDLCQGEEYLAIDLEFSSFGNYQPTLQLAQIATRSSVIGVIDFQALGERAYPIIELMASRKAIMFGCNSDLAILEDLEDQFDISGLPRQLFDAQVAASFLSLGEFNGRSNLGACVETVLGIKLQKGYGGSDWSRRPLSLEQIDYAMDDVRHLHELHDKLVQMLHDEPTINADTSVALPTRYELYLSEMRTLLANPQVVADPNEAWLSLKGIPSHATPQQLGIMRQLSKWRELEARRANRFPRAIMRDEIIVGLGTKPPTTLEEMNLFMSTTQQGYFSATNSALLETITCATPIDETTMALYTPRANRTTEYIQQATQLVLLGISNRVRIDPEFLAGFNEMKRFASLKTEEEEDKLAMFQGFRRELVGLPLRAVKRGATVQFSVHPSQKQLSLEVVKESPLNEVD